MPTRQNKLMFWNVMLLSAITIILSAGEVNENTWNKNSDGSAYSYKQSDFTTFEYNPDTPDIVLKGYTLSPGGAPDGYSYVAEKTIASGGGLNVSYESPQHNQNDANSKFRRLQLSQSGSPTATLYVRTNNSPAIFNISMSGDLTKSGDGTGQVTWSASVGTNFFWVDTPQDKVLTIAVGNNASASAHSPADSSYEKSTWKIIPSSGSTATIDNAMTTISYNTIFAHKPMFVNSAFQGVPAGKHQVEGTSVKDTSKKDNAIWEVVQGDFYDNGSLTFDDYTNFEPQNSYYINNSSYGKNSRGRAQAVYIVKKLGVDAKTTLNLTPSPISKDVLVGTSDTTKQTKSYSISSSGTLNAKLDSSTLCSVTVYEYEAVARSILFVKVRKGSSGVIPDLPNRSNISAVYDKVNIAFSQYEHTMPYPSYPTNDIWDNTSLNTLKSYLINNTSINSNNYRHLIFVVFGDEPGVSGRGEQSGKYIIIYQNHNQSTVPHEMGHNYNLAHTGENGGGDSDNLMTIPSNSRIKLRKNQWTEVRK